MFFRASDKKLLNSYNKLWEKQKLNERRIR